MIMIIHYIGSNRDEGERWNGWIEKIVITHHDFSQ